MAIYRALLRSGLIVKGERKKVLETHKRWERGRPMELWQMDVVGSIFTTDGTEAKILTGIDDHSRFIICAGVMARATARPVCEHFVAALSRWGVPEEILTDIQDKWRPTTLHGPAGCVRIEGARRLSVTDADRSKRVLCTTSCLLFSGRTGATPGKARPIENSATGTCVADPC